MPSAEFSRLFKGEQKEVYVKSINQSTESNLKNGVVPLEEWRLKVDIILAGKVATRRYKMVQKPADVSGGSQSKTHKITSVMIKTILMKKIDDFFLLKPVFSRFNFRGPQECRDNRGRSFNKVYKKKTGQTLLQAWRSEMAFKWR